MKPVPPLSARPRTASLNMSIFPANSARGAAAANGVTPQSGIEMSSTRPASPSANPIAVLVSEANQQCHYIERTLKVGGHDRGCEVESVSAGGRDHFRFGGRPALNAQFHTSWAGQFSSFPTRAPTVYESPRASIQISAKGADVVSAGTSAICTSPSTEQAAADDHGCRD